MGGALTAEEEFIGAMQAIRGRWRSFEVESSVLQQVDLGSGPRPIYIGFVYGILGEHEVGSFLVVTHYNEMAIKVRATFPAGDEDEVWSTVTEFLEYLDAQASTPAV